MVWAGVSVGWRGTTGAWAEAGPAIAKTDQKAHAAQRWPVGMFVTMANPSHLTVIRSVQETPDHRTESVNGRVSHQNRMNWSDLFRWSDGSKKSGCRQAQEFATNGTARRFLANSTMMNRRDNESKNGHKGEKRTGFQKMVRYNL
jgi:hypothetical protein